MLPSLCHICDKLSKETTLGLTSSVSLESAQNNTALFSSTPAPNLGHTSSASTGGYAPNQTTSSESCPCGASMPQHTVTTSGWPPGSGSSPSTPINLKTTLAPPPHPHSRQTYSASRQLSDTHTVLHTSCSSRTSNKNDQDSDTETITSRGESPLAYCGSGIPGWHQRPGPGHGPGNGSYGSVPGIAHGTVSSPSRYGSVPCNGNTHDHCDGRGSKRPSIIQSLSPCDSRSDNTTGTPQPRFDHSMTSKSPARSASSSLKRTVPVVLPHTPARSISAAAEFIMQTLEYHKHTESDEAEPKSESDYEYEPEMQPMMTETAGPVHIHRVASRDMTQVTVHKEPETVSAVTGSKSESESLTGSLVHGGVLRLKFRSHSVEDAQSANACASRQGHGRFPGPVRCSSQCAFAPKQLLLVKSHKEELSFSLPPKVDCGAWC
jgi:hypothetical protein